MENSNVKVIKEATTDAATAQEAPQLRMGNLYWHLVKDQYKNDPVGTIEERFGNHKGFLIGIPQEPQPGYTKVRVSSLPFKGCENYCVPALSAPVGEANVPWLFGVKHAAPLMGEKEGILFHLHPLAKVPEEVLNHPALGMFLALSGRFPLQELSELPETLDGEKTFGNLMHFFANHQEEKAAQVFSLREACALAWDRILEFIKTPDNTKFAKEAALLMPLCCFTIKSDEDLMAEKLTQLRTQQARQHGVASAGKSSHPAAKTGQAGRKARHNQAAFYQQLRGEANG